MHKNTPFSYRHSENRKTIPGLDHFQQADVLEGEDLKPLEQHSFITERLNEYCSFQACFLAKTMDVVQPLSAGTHGLVFKLWDANGFVYTASKNVSVR